ncbi:MAG: hypothetical protein JSS66_01980 [Armatimonadetes bacterium]|nr:hypothetical protein [Armatimonadota bacterium]
MVGIARSITTACLALLVLAGCGDRGQWVGDWKGRRALAVPPGEDPYVGESLAVVKLSILNDGHVKLTEESIGKQGSMAISGNTATITVETALDRPIGNLGKEGEALGGQRNLTLNKDGTITFARPGLEDVVLKRIQTAAP